MSDSITIFQASLLKLLKPLVRVMLRNGITFKEFAEVAKHAYVEVAAQDFEIEGKRQTDSRISTITGLTRKEVLRLRSLPQDDALMLTAQFNRAARVINYWVRSEAFLDALGEPLALPFAGGDLSFGELVRRSSGDIPARTILDELLHVGVVEELADGTIRLLTRAYVPIRDNVEKIKILGTDVADLISTIDHNLAAERGHTYFQRKVCYNNLPAEALPELKPALERMAQAALEEMNEKMMACDRDSNGTLKGSGRKRAGIGIFYFEEEQQERDR